MAQKRAIVFIIDVGSTMGDCHNGRTISDLDWSMQWAWDKMANIMSRGLKGDNVGVIGLRTDESNNPMAESDSSYEHISVLKELGVLEMPDLRSLQEAIKPSETEDGDAISAIAIATESIAKFTTLKTGKLGKFERAIYLLTDGQGGMDGEELDPIAERINELEIKLTVIGVDFDSEDSGFVEEDKSSLKKQNEAYLKTLTEKCTSSAYATALEAIDEISTPYVKDVRPIASYTGVLQLGDIEKYPESVVSIDVIRYPKTKTAKPVSASNFVPRQKPKDEHVVDDGQDLSSVKNLRNYLVLDPSGPKGVREVQREDLAKGYTYGRTLVPLSEEDANVSRLETFRSFSIMGFIPMEKYEKYLNMGEANISIAPYSNDKARMAMSSLVRALHETESYGVARLVLKDMKDPQVVLLAPLIEPGLDALIDVTLPFAEDIRVYQFPPLDRVITTSGAILSQHRNLPSQNLLDAMSDYVDAMDLSKFGEDDEGGPSEYAPIDDTYNPSIHRINQAIRTRAIYPDQSLGEPAEILTKYSKPPADLVSSSEKSLTRLVSVADVKKVEERKKGRGKRNRGEGPAPLSGLDVDAILGGAKRQKLSRDNALPEFKQMIAAAEDNNAEGEAMKQMGDIVQAVIKDSSMGDTGYDIAVRYIGEMKRIAVELEIPEFYNDFAQDLKKKLANSELGTDRQDFWLKFRRSDLGLITTEQTSFSKISEEEAKQFYDISSTLAHRPRD